MSDEPKSTTTPSAPPTPKLSPNPLKRKELSEEPETKPLSTSAPLTADGTVLPEEYKNGLVHCQVCGLQVNIRDRDTGGFTVQMWEEHRARCFPASSTAGGGRDAVIYTPESTAQALAHPPAKKRRAKRTEEERIDYLRADPYVAEFEPYRALCASCDKWIRLRPNSTYCSIPWDAHRKSCLAKKINNKNAYAFEERNNLFSKDPDIRKFDAERLLCNRCDQWLGVPAHDHSQAVDKWLHHRASCNKASPSSSSSRTAPKDTIPRGPPLSETQLALASSSSTSTAVDRASPSPGRTSSPKTPHHHHPRAPPHPSHPAPPFSSPGTKHPAAPPRNTGPSTTAAASAHHHTSTSPSPSFHDLTPTNFAPVHESRRRNADQRAAKLRADSLIGEVEPNRVFCSLCQKWVQLRQDSSFCSYPWVQHRGKCLARHQRRVQKAAEVAEFKMERQAGGASAGGGSASHNTNTNGGNEDDDDDLMGSEDNDASSDESGDEGGAPSADAHGESGAGSRSRKRASDAHHHHHNQHQQHRHSAAPPPSPATARVLAPRGGEYQPPHSHHHHQHAHHAMPTPSQQHHKMRAPHYAYPGGALPYSLERSSLRRETWRGGREHVGVSRAGGGYAQGSSASSVSSSRRAQYHQHQQHQHQQQHQQQQQRGWEVDDVDAEGEADADGESYIEDEPAYSSSLNRRGGQMHHGNSNNSNNVRRMGPIGLADLDSPSGRKHFVASSIDRLFTTTYDAPSDDLPISALVAYLNAAMPLDKHEDFDTAEVVRYVAALRERGRVGLQGDLVRVV